MMTDVPAAALRPARPGRVAEGATPTSWCSIPTPSRASPPRAARPARRRRTPHAEARGIEQVFVGGAIVVDGEPTGARPGSCCGPVSTPTP